MSRLWELPYQQMRKIIIYWILKKRFKNMENLLKCWTCRHLSLKGKIAVINTLALSPLLYIANTVHVPQRVFSEVRKIISDFLWDGKPAKISYDTLVQPIESGGLKLIDFEIKIKSLHAAWVKRLASDTCSKPKAAAAFFLKTDNLKFMFQCNRKQTTRYHSRFMLIYQLLGVNWIR